MSGTTPEANDHVLSTLNRDGTRRRIRPNLSRGAFYRRRRVVAYLLFAAFTLTPYLSCNGKPLILLDVPARKFTLFGTTFLPTETILLVLLLLALIVGIFLLTALFGRVWCGWACPQTVYMEFIYRPIERLFEGSPAKQRRLDRGPGGSPRRLLKNVAFLIVSAFVAHTFLAYFVGVERLLQWVQRSPADHPAAFGVMAVVTVAMFIDFAWFREQTCIIACPYGRLQSVLLDRQSLIVGYDAGRGEPRAHLKRSEPGAERGDCIDCGACVTTCPTGIDIREGLQMECLHCTQCIDACDAIMTRVGRPTGLIRMSSQDQLAGQPKQRLRPRVVIYPLIMALVIGLLTVELVRRESAEVVVLRAIGAPYTRPSAHRVSNGLRIKVINRSSEPRRYKIELLDANDAQVIAPINPLVVAAGREDTAPLFVVCDAARFRDGVREIRLRISDGKGFRKELPYRLLGPEGRGG